MSCGKAVLSGVCEVGGNSGEGTWGRVLNRCRGKKNMSVLFCVRQTAERGEVGAGVTRLRAAAAAVGRGSRAGPRESRPAATSACRRRGRPLSSHDPGPSRARPAPTLGAPARARGARGARSGRPSKVSSARGVWGEPSSLDSAPPAGPAPRWAGEPTGGPSRGPRGDPPPRRPAWAWAWEARWSTGDLPGPPSAGVTLPPNHAVGSGLTRVRAGRSAWRSRRRVLGAPPRTPRRPLERSLAVLCAGAGRRGPRPRRRGGVGSGRSPGRCPARPPGHPRAAALGVGVGGGKEMAASARPRRRQSKAGDGGPPRCPRPGPGHERIFILG